MSLSTIVATGVMIGVALVAITDFRIERRYIHLYHQQTLLEDCERVLGYNDERTIRVREHVQNEKAWFAQPFYVKAFKN